MMLATERGRDGNAVGDSRGSGDHAGAHGTGTEERTVLIPLLMVKAVGRNSGQ